MAMLEREELPGGSSMPNATDQRSHPTPTYERTPIGRQFPNSFWLVTRDTGLKVVASSPQTPSDNPA